MRQIRPPIGSQPALVFNVVLLKLEIALSARRVHDANFGPQAFSFPRRSANSEARRMGARRMGDGNFAATPRAMTGRGKMSLREMIPDPGLPSWSIPKRPETEALIMFD